MPTGFLIMGVSGSGKSTLEAGRHPVLACSALKEKYRARLLDGVEDIVIIYLKGEYETIWPRLRSRERHYMRENMLQSQFEALEEPENALILGVSIPIREMLEAIFSKYNTLKK